MRRDFPLISIRMERSPVGTQPGDGIPLPIPFCRRGATQISAGDFADYSMLILRAQNLEPDCRGTAFFDEFIGDGRRDGPSAMPVPGKGVRPINSPLSNFTTPVRPEPQMGEVASSMPSLPSQQVGHYSKSATNRAR